MDELVECDTQDCSAIQLVSPWEGTTDTPIHHVKKTLLLHFRGVRLGELRLSICTCVCALMTTPNVFIASRPTLESSLTKTTFDITIVVGLGILGVDTMSFKHVNYHDFVCTNQIIIGIDFWQHNREREQTHRDIGSKHWWGNQRGNDISLRRTLKES